MYINYITHQDSTLRTVLSPQSSEIRLGQVKIILASSQKAIM